MSAKNFYNLGNFDDIKDIHWFKISYNKNEIRKVEKVDYNSINSVYER
ncbi:hypothetical protein GCM10007096_33860 [Pullulanibacillus pueri]|uniref:Uncharacterized protein n=1 Tax=Pullulanibacillus pueri TaxID=1437324 RepID=A0A8J2ZYD2_9BACL|nr:hypothetical protein GCM10007096_33860 [Pullulanibacillus pueri]